MPSNMKKTQFSNLILLILNVPTLKKYCKDSVNDKLCFDLALTLHSISVSLERECTGHKQNLLCSFSSQILHQESNSVKHKTCQYLIDLCRQYDLVKPFLTLRISDF